MSVRGPFSGFQPPTFEDEEADVGFLDDDDIRLLFDDEEPELTEEELW